jgi:spore photoproduct lyase
VIKLINFPYKEKLMNRDHVNTNQLDLFGNKTREYSLPADFEPVRPGYLDISRIILAKGSVPTPERREFVDRICQLYPGVVIHDRTETPHNRIDLGETDILALHNKGKHILVFAELNNAVRFSEEEGNTCPNYWHFSPYGFCPHGCKYCYLAGTQGVKFSPTIKIYVNLPEILKEIDIIAKRLAKPTAFYLGKLQDSLALDPLTAYSTVLIPFFAGHPYARLTLLTKSINVNRLLDLQHESHTILSWSINPPEICRVFEENVPDVEERLESMRKTATAGYPIRAVMMPIIPVGNWQRIYIDFTKLLLETVPIQRLTLGGICIYSGAKRLLDLKMGGDNTISNHIEYSPKNTGDGRARYPRELRKSMYSIIVEVARKIRPDLEIALCLEEKSVWDNLRLESYIGRCNCGL